ncbi:MAG: hypothetical protein AAF226_10765, partial [Verrucomicrobiota bacterium]
MSCEQSQKRNTAIKKAVGTSILSKVGTLLLRLLSIPVAIEVLGMDQFGVYAAILVIVQLIDVFHVGIGPALTQLISKAVVAGDRDKEIRSFSTGVSISAGLTVLVGSIMFAIVWFVPTSEIFGDKFLAFEDSMRRACLIAIVILGGEFLGVTIDKVRDGYMETRYTNSWGAAGNFVGAGLLLFGISHFRSIEFLVIAVNGSIVAAKICNSVHLLIQRPYLIPRPATFDSSLIKPLFKGGALLTIIYAAAAIAEYNIMTYMAGRFGGPELSGNFSIMVTLHLSAIGMIQMLTIPAWPAIMDAFERGDLFWVSRTARKLRLVALGVVFISVVGAASIGLW